MKSIRDIAQQLINPFNILSKFRLEIGVFTLKTKRKIQIGITNAELMFIHENGSPIRHIPARPVLQMTIDYVNQNLLQNVIDKCVTIILDKNANEQLIRQELEKLAIKIENYARKLIYSNDGRLAPNAPSVARAKGGNHPLFNTGQLARSITCRVVKEGEEI